MLVPTAGLADEEAMRFLALVVCKCLLFQPGAIMEGHARRASELATEKRLCIAWFRRRPEVGVIVYSERGAQYCSGLFQDTLKDYGMLSSMTRRGDCRECAD
jgi:putative transposase